MRKGYVSFFILYVLSYPLRYLSFKTIHSLGRGLGSALYLLVPKFRKRSLSNVALATGLHLTPAQIRAVAKQSLQNLMITCLEYIKLDATDDISQLVTCTNPQVAEQLIAQGTPPIFFCGHQANWELLFLEGCTRMKGIAIGRPIQNSVLYDFVLNIRQKFGGRIIAPKQAIKEGLRALRHGLFLGIVGDQGMPDGGHCSPFLGRKAWSSSMPALLSYRTGSPLIVATTQRESGRYTITYSDPIWPDKKAAMDQEVDRLMRSALSVLEESILQRPHEWLFSHNRWKQQLPGKLKKQFRHESILIILPTPQERLSLDLSTQKISEMLQQLKELYPEEFITLYVPFEEKDAIPITCEEIIPYTTTGELFKEDYRFKLLFNFTPHHALSRHFKRLSAFTAVNVPCNLNTLLTCESHAS